MCHGYTYVKLYSTGRAGAPMNKGSATKRSGRSRGAVDGTQRAEARLLSELGGRIREARRRRHMSGRELAGLADVTPSFISQIELGQATPSVSTLFRITQALGIDMGDLF